MSAIGNVDDIIVLHQHPKDCPVCTDGWVQVHRVRWRDGVETVSRVGRIRQCPRRSGSDDLYEFVGVSGSAPDGPEGAA